MNKKAIFNWSGGKDSALCLYNILQSDQYDVLCLLTSINEQHQRISMHGVRVELLETQAKNIGIPLIKVIIPEFPTMETYEEILSKTLSKLIAKGATESIFGDIFLEDLRAYREQKLTNIGLNGVFPLWKIPTKDVILKFLQLGFKTIVTCVNEQYLDKSFVGRIIDEEFLLDLPENVDPCGENGEFHTFVFDGPIFKNPIPITLGEIVHKEYPAENNKNNGFWFCDLLPK